MSADSARATAGQHSAGDAAEAGIFCNVHRLPKMRAHPGGHGGRPARRPGLRALRPLLERLQRTRAPHRGAPGGRGTRAAVLAARRSFRRARRGCGSPGIGRAASVRQRARGTHPDPGRGVARVQSGDHGRELGVRAAAAGSAVDRGHRLVSRAGGGQPGDPGGGAAAGLAGRRRNRLSLPRLDAAHRESGTRGAARAARRACARTAAGSRGCATRGAQHAPRGTPGQEPAPSRAPRPPGNRSGARARSARAAAAGACHAGPVSRGPQPRGPPRF